MPNRILKESICSSDTIDRLSLFEEVTFYRLLVTCDDYGRFDARPKILKSRLFPLRTEPAYNDKAIDKAIDTLVSVGLVTRYRVDGHDYLYITSWSKHQQTRAAKSKFPSPDEGELVEHDSVSDNQISDDIKCTNDESPVFVSLVLSNGSNYNVTESDVSEYKNTFPGIDVEGELRKMAMWCRDNPQRRKTKTGIRKFISGWLGRVSPGKSTGNVFADILREGIADDA